MNKLLLFLIVHFILATGLMAQTATQPSGNGTETDPFQISTLENLYWLSQADSIWNDSMYFEQTANIDASDTKNWDGGNGFMPIGNVDTTFKGIFNGKGHIISNLYINRSDKIGVGLFGEIESSQIDSLGVVRCRISGDYRVGGLAGRSYGSYVSNCFVSGIVTGVKQNVGGLVGINTFSSVITNCYVSAVVSGTIQIGGLTGANYHSSFIVRSYATGSVIGTDYRTGGLTGANYDFSTIENSYATGKVSGKDRVGGLVGENYTNSKISNCYSTCNISGAVLSQTGGLIGSNNVTSIADNCYYNKETSGQANGIGKDNNSQSVTGLSTFNMKQYTSFTGFGLVWGIRSDKTYPALQTLDNAPFAFADTLSVSASVSFEEFLANDYDYETFQTALTLKIVELDAGTCSNNRIYFPYTAENGDIINLTYQVGEIRTAKNDTLWANMASGVLTYTSNSAPEITVDTIVTKEDISLSIQNNFIGTDSDSDLLTISILDTSVNGDLMQTNDSMIYMPYTNYNGLDSMRLVASDGILSDTAWVFVHVEAINDAPVITSVQDKTIDEDISLTLTLSDLIANDADGNSLSIIIYIGDNYVVNENSVTAGLNFNGNLSVPVAVTDGIDTSNILNMIVEVNAVNEAPKITSTATGSATVGLTYIYIVKATDQDSDVLTYALSGEPEGMTVTENVIAWVPTESITTSGEVTLTVSDGELSDTETFTLTVSNSGRSGIEDIETESILVFPNPVGTSLTVKSNSTMENIQLVSLNGAVVFAESVNGVQKQLSLEVLPAGVYIVKIKTDEGMQVRKIIKE